MKIGIVGNGAVGNTTATGFRAKGHAVYINDLKSSKEEKIFDKKYLMDACDLIFICVPTPPKPDGALDTVFVDQAVAELNDLRKQESDSQLIVIRSTVPPGTTVRLTNTFPSLNFASNPEFLRMNQALHDFLHPERIVIGANDEKVARKVTEAYVGWDCPFVITDPNTAETIKLVANCFLAYKVAFSCEVAGFCKALGINAKEVMDAVCMDSRIGSSHLDPSKGPIPRNSHCLPKDMAGLIRHLEKNGYDSHLLKLAYKVGVENQQPR